MKTGEIAKSLGVHPKTINLWVDRDEFEGLFSPGATKNSGKAQRDFDLNDQVLLNTIRFLRNEEGLKDWNAIAIKIHDGYRQNDMPAEYFVTENTTPVRAFTTLIEVRKQLEQVVKERDQLLEELNLERENRRKAEAELNREIGKLEGQLEFLRKQL